MAGEKIWRMRNYYSPAFSVVGLFLFFYVCGCLSSLDSTGRVLNSWQQENEGGNSIVHCSRSRSRTARAILDEYLVPFLEQQQYNLSTKCRLHPENNMFQEQESQKDTIRPTQWQCNHCKKMFRTEEFLDKHFDNRHHDMLDMSPNRCLADVCGALHCDYVASQTKISRSKPCNRAAVDKNKHLCESLANSCFPTDEGATPKRLHDFFLRQFCDSHTCNRDQKIFPRGSGKHRNRSLFFAFSLFTIICLIIFYVAIFLYRRDIAMNATNLKRLAKHGVLRSQSGKRH
ncbi:unnamed protein product [Calypogeia fissa]